MKKLLLSILVILLMAGNANLISASSKSIYTLGQQKQIDNVSQGIPVTIQEKDGMVFYGTNGIDVVFDDEDILHLDTVFSVKKLCVISDINNDGYPEYFTYQDASEYTDQLFIVDGYTGESLASANVTRPVVDDELGRVYKNTSVLKIACSKDYCYVLSDYNLIQYDFSLNEVARFTDENNIWDFAFLNGKCFLSDQLGQMIVLDENLEVVDKLQLANKITIIGYDDKEYEIQMNLWQISTIDDFIYATSEDGILYKIDPETLAYEECDLTVVTKEQLEAEYKDYYGTDYSTVAPTGIRSDEFKNYKIVDVTDNYLLIGAYFIDEANTNSNSSLYGPYYVMVERASFKVIGITDVANYSDNTSALIKETEAEPKILLAYNDESSTTFVTLKLDGQLETTKTVTLNLDSNYRIVLSRYQEGILVETYHSGAYLLTENLTLIKAMFSKVTCQLILKTDDKIIVGYKTNGKMNHIVCYSSDLSTVLWQYTIDVSNNNGLKNVIADDYDGDGMKDICSIYTVVNEKNENQYTQFLFINGQNGSLLVNGNINMGYQYDEKGKRSIAYLITSDFGLMKDVNGDKKKEILVDYYMISSKNLKVAGYIDDYVDDSGSRLGIGDLNDDLLDDFVVISDKKITLYQSSASSNGVTYKKVKSVVLNEKAYNSTSYSILGDLNNDGVLELVLNDINKDNYQVFDVYDGKTLTKLYTLCPNGVSEIENYATTDIDLNNDGYYELKGFSSSDWTYKLYNGKTGELIKCYEVYSLEDPEYYEENTDYYHPEGIIQMGNDFYEFLVTGFSDINNDGLIEYGVTKRYWNEDTNWEDVTAIIIYDGKTSEQLGSISISGMSKYQSIDSIMQVENSNYRYYAFISGSTTYLYDIQDENVICSYPLTGESYDMLSNDNLIIKNGTQLYIASIKSAFEVENEISESTSDYLLNLQWKSLVDYSVMTIYDNDNMVYSGSDSSYQLQLLEGDHTIRMSLKDSTGRSSEKTFKITVEKQSNKQIWVVGLTFVLLLIAIACNLYRKQAVRKELKEML